MAIKLIASDLDGTLFGADHVPEQRTVDAINAHAAAGTIIAAVTGRSWFGGIERATRTGAHLDWFIGSNGGHRVNVASGELVERLVFDGESLDVWLAAIEAEFGAVGFGFEHDDGMSWTPRFYELHPHMLDGGARFDTSAEKSKNSVGKFFISNPNCRPEDMLDSVRAILPDNIEVTTSGVGSVEVMPECADKGSALDRLCTEIGVSQGDVIAFGDNLNDLTMIEWAGRGVAMGNAVAEVHAIADEATATNVDFGVAQVLETLL